MSLTQPTDRPTSYLSYRLTAPHECWPDIRAILDSRAKNWIVALHFPDNDDKKEHFHMAFWDFPAKNVDSMKLAFSRHFDQKGNGLHRSKTETNHISEAISYMKHDPLVVFHHTGEAHWDHLIESSPVFVKDTPAPGKVFKEKLTDPTLTHSNVLKQAVKFQKEHMASEHSLQNVLSRMVHQSNWVPSRDLLRNGIPREFHEMFMDRVTKKQRVYAWMAPHVPSDDKAKWLDRPDSEPIIAGYIPSSAGDSAKLWTGKNMNPPSI